MKFGVLNDLHFADHPPSGRQEGYTDQLFAKLLGVAAILEERKADSLIITGDLFHVKRPDRNSYALTNRLIETLKNDFTTDIKICPGNHDLTESGIESLWRQPLGAVCHSEDILALIKDEGWACHDTNGQPVLFIGRHYDAAGDLDPFYYVPTQEEARIVKAYRNAVIVMVAHGSIVPPGAAPIYPHITADQIPWQDAPFVPDLLLCGHLHEDYGIKKVEDGPIYANLGSFGRPSRNQYVDKRDFLFVTITKTGKIQLERIPIPNMLPADQVFREKVEEFEDDAMAQFAEQLASSITLEDTPLEEALAALGDDVPKPVRDRVQKYLEEAGL